MEVAKATFEQQTVTVNDQQVKTNIRKMHPKITMFLI
jgi:hypothetical protein